jgi:hypothetical protein
LAGDVDGDGNLDLVGAGPVVLLGKGDGTFTYKSSQSLARGDQFGALLGVLGDVNGDGKLDLVTTVGPSYVVYFQGNGDGTFQSYQIIDESYTNGSQGGVLAADFNGDGKLDFAYYHNECADSGAGPCAGNLDFYLGNGNGTFQSPLTLGGLATLNNSPEIIAGDFNGDGKLDLAFDGNLLLLGVGSSPFSYSLLSIPDNQVQNVIGDFSGTGRLGIAGAPVSNVLVADLNVIPQIPPTPDFGATSSAAYQTVVAGNSATYTITITAIDGFSGVVTPSVSGLRDGAVPSFNPPTVTGSGTTVLSIATSASLATQNYQFDVSLTSGALVHGGGLTLNVGPAGTSFGDFTGSIPKTYANSTPGGSVGYGITIIPLNGFTGNVSLTASGLPAGATFSFNPATITGGSGSTALTVSTASGTPTGSYPFTFTATSGSLVHSTQLVVNVGPAGSNFGNFTGSVTPTSATVTAGSGTAITIALQPLYGYVGNASVTLSPLPSGMGASGNQTVPVPGSTVISISTSSSLTPGTYVLTFTVTGSNSFGAVQHSSSVTITVLPPATESLRKHGSIAAAGAVGGIISTKDARLVKSCAANVSRGGLFRWRRCRSCPSSSWLRRRVWLRRRRRPERPSARAE